MEIVVVAIYLGACAFSYLTGRREGYLDGVNRSVECFLNIIDRRNSMDLREGGNDYY